MYTTEIVTDHQGPFKTYCLGGKAREMIEYKKYNNKLYLHLITLAQINIDYDTVNRKTYINEYTNELLVTRVNPSGCPVPDGKRIMDWQKSMESQVTKYNGEFWKNYNMIKLSNPDRQMIQDLEQDLTLEEQFRKRTFKEIERERIDAFQVESNIK